MINRGLISGRHGDNNQWGQGVAIGGTHAKVINYGTIKTSNQNAYGILIATSAHTPVLEFLGGQVFVDHASSEIIHSFAQDTSAGSSYPGVKLTLGGTLGKAGVKAKIFETTALAKDVIILLPGAQVLGGGRFHLHILEDVVKVGNFYDGDEPIGTRTGWVNFHGSLDFGKYYIYGTQPVIDSDEMIIDTDYGIRFSPPNAHLKTVVDTPKGDEESVINNLETLRIERGSLVFAGQINMLHDPNSERQHYDPDAATPVGCEMCTFGKVYIHDAGRLIFEIGKDPASAANDNMIISTLRAEELIFTGDNPRVFIQFATDLTEDEIKKFRGFLPTSATTDMAELQRSKILLVNKVYHKYVKASDTKTEYTGSGLEV